MKSIFNLELFEFPYDYKFPGQASDEKILYLTRENRFVLVVQQLFILVAAVALLVAGVMLRVFVFQSFSISISPLFEVTMLGLIALFVLIGWWWVNTTWKKSIALVTTRRLIKFIYTTPASRYSLSLPLATVVDTGAYTKGFLQSFLKLGTFTARSSASSSGVATDNPDRINKKYFYIKNVKKAEDLQHYVSKLLGVFQTKPDEMARFRPFIPDLKGEERANFIKQNFPDFWS